MAWILMQPASDKASLEAAKLMETSGDCPFDLTKNGPRLQPVAYGSRSCTEMEKHFHSFVGEVCCGRWAFAQNKRYLWGTHFYWICDCSAVREVLDYRGTIHMICRWSQEMLGYNFSVVHREARMMEDVDALSRMYDRDTATHCMIASSLKAQDETLRPDAYNSQKFSKKPTRLKASAPITENIIPILTGSNIRKWYLGSLAISSSCRVNVSPHFMLHTAPISLIKPQEVDSTRQNNNRHDNSSVEQSSKERYMSSGI